MQWVLIVLAAMGISNDNVVLINHTGLKIIRIEIGDRKLEEVKETVDGIVVKVSPGRHNLRLVFKGGGAYDWPDFNFKGVRQIVFERRKKNKIEALAE